MVYPTARPSHAVTHSPYYKSSVVQPTIYPVVGRQRPIEPGSVEVVLDTIDERETQRLHN